MHGDLSLGGPVFAFGLFVFVLTALAAAYVAVDSLRRPDPAFERIPEPRWLYTVPQLVYLVLFMLALVPVVTRVVGLPLVAMTPIALATQVAYLLRVVFPKPPAKEADSGEHAVRGGEGDL